MGAVTSSTWYRSTAQSCRSNAPWTAGEDWRTEPIVPPWDTPGRYVGIPSAPLVQHDIYLPVVLKHSVP